MHPSHSFEIIRFLFALVSHFYLPNSILFVTFFLSSRILFGIHFALYNTTPYHIHVLCWTCTAKGGESSYTAAHVKSQVRILVALFPEKHTPQ